MLEGVEPKSASAGIDHAQDVAVELGRHAGAVVVGGLEHRAVLDEVGADHEACPLAAHHVSDPREEARPLGGVEVADRAAQEREQAVAAVEDPLEVAAEVAHQAVHVEARVDLGELGGAGVHDRLVDVEGHVALEAALTRHRRTGAAASWTRCRAQLDELLGPGLLHDRCRGG